MTRKVTVVLSGLCTLIFAIWFAVQSAPKDATAFEQMCGHTLREKLCFVDMNGIAECGLDEQRFYVLEDKLLSVFKAVPTQVQQKLCSIGAIAISYPSNGIEPWMGAFTNGEVIGINMLKWLNIGMPYENWEHSKLVWYPTETGSGYKLQSSEKIKVKFTHDSEFQVGLNYTLANDILHEVGHLIAFDIGDTPFKCLSNDTESEFAKAAQLEPPSEPAYCESYIKGMHSTELLTKLQNSAYASLYATCSPQEDFAETYVQFIMTNHLNRYFAAYVGEKKVYDQKAHQTNLGLKAKYKLIEYILHHNTNDEADRAHLQSQLQYCFGPFATP